MMGDFANVNALWSAVAAGTLVAQGACEVVISPGSRSTPLTAAFVAHPGLRCHAVLDERSAGFVALGLAKATRRPAVLLCTSGSAPAHYLPAVIEASRCGVPLLVLTADRPPEMRGCRSGQTIDQSNLFGAHARHWAEAPLPSPSASALAGWRDLILDCLSRARGTFPGPVQLDVPFRDPLAPQVRGEACSADVDAVCGPARLCDAEPVAFEGVLPAWKRGIAVVGAAWSGRPALALARTFSAAGWPVLADVVSGLRGQVPGVLTAYDAVLRAPAASAALRPDGVVLVDCWPTSKVLRAWLAGAGIPCIAISDSDEHPDAVHLPSTRWPLSGLRLASAPVAADPAFADAWKRADARARASLDASLDAAPAATESLVAREVARTLRRGRLLLASSLCVRDFEWFAAALAPDVEVCHNRGANGIDGLVSTASGLALADAATPVVLVCGDLAFLHDAGGLLAARQVDGGSLTIAVVDNSGGGIFESLPIAKGAPALFEAWFATPQPVDIAALCVGYGVPCHECATAADLAAHIRECPRGVRVLRLRTDRKSSMSWRQKAFADAAKALG